MHKNFVILTWIRAHGKTKCCRPPGLWSLGVGYSMLYHTGLHFLPCGSELGLTVHSTYTCVDKRLKFPINDFFPSFIKLIPTLVMKPHLTFWDSLWGLWGKHMEMSGIFQYYLLSFLLHLTKPQNMA